jgi:type IV pilus assembly protein PilE
LRNDLKFLSMSHMSSSYPHSFSSDDSLGVSSRVGVVRRAIGWESGFTLIEAMIVVAMIAILAGIALPSYRDYVTRAQIVDGLVPLADMGGKLEQYFQDNRTYVGACTANTVATLPGATARFSYACTLAASTYTVTATGLGNMSGFVFTLNQNGLRQTTGTPTGWTAGSNCWSARKDGSC